MAGETTPPPPVPPLPPSSLPSHVPSLPLQEKFHDIEEKYKEAMVSSAQLYNEKTALVYQVESLKDR